MSNKCGECEFFYGAGKKCGGGMNRTATSSACSNGFKGAASLFNGKQCGGCRLFNGPHEKCGAGMNRTSTSSACSNSYSPILG